MNKTLLLLLVLAVCLNLHARCALEADRDIPIPKFTAQQAMERVGKYYRDSKDDPERFVISVTYGRPDHMSATLGNNFVRGDEQEWSWFVTYTHPKKGNSTEIFRLKDNGEIYPLIQTRT